MFKRAFCSIWLSCCFTWCDCGAMATTSSYWPVSVSPHWRQIPVPPPESTLKFHGVHLTVSSWFRGLASLLWCPAFSSSALNLILFVTSLVSLVFTSFHPLLITWSSVFSSLFSVGTITHYCVGEAEFFFFLNHSHGVRFPWPSFIQQAGFRQAFRYSRLQ